MPKQENLKLNMPGLQECEEDKTKPSGRKPIHLRVQGKPNAVLFADSEVSHQIVREILKRREAKKTCDGAENQKVTKVVKRFS